MPERQGSLFDSDVLAPSGGWRQPVERIELARGAWLDVCRQWMVGSDALLDRLKTSVAWHAERRQMYDRVVAVPRLTHFYGEDESLPDPALGEVRSSLNERYGELPGGPLCSVGVCLYRDGRDSVAWHGDRVGRASTEDTVVAILTLGSTRRFSLRPRGGGRAMPFDVGAGDLFVMGGSCQRTWEHCVTKTSRTVGARVSVQFRQRGVR